MTLCKDFENIRKKQTFLGSGIGERGRGVGVEGKAERINKKKCFYKYVHVFISQIHKVII